MSTQQIIDGWEHGQEPYSETPTATDQKLTRRQAKLKSEVLDSISDLGAIEAVEELAGMLSYAIESGQADDIAPIMAVMRSIEKELEIWADLKAKETVPR